MPRTVKLLLIIQFMTLPFAGSCARKGLVSESIPPQLYDFKRELPDSTYERNPVFLVYGDNRPSWRLVEGFMEKRNWSRKRLLLFPVYLPVLLFNAVFGGTAYIRHVPDLGHEIRKKVLHQIYEEINRSNIDFIAHTGDIVENGTYFSHWEEFLTETVVEQPVMQLVPFYPAPGNHERLNEEIYGKYNYDTVFPNSRF